MDSEIEDHITEKFNVKKLLGKGAYGFVWKVEDKKSNEIMALKKIFDAFRNKTDAQRTYREIVYLREFGHHPNIIKLINVFKANNSKDIYLMFEFMESDLHSAIRKNNILEDVHKKYIMYQLFKAMKYLHSAKVIHRDLKPSNVLLNRNCLMKVCDFGLARSLSQIPIDEGGSPNLTEYVATRWYRAPEILLASHRYTTGVDQWSLGCILGEMLLGKALFQGSSTLDQLEKILSVVEKPSRKDIENIHSNYGATILQQKLKKPHSNLQSLLPNVNFQAISLVRQLLHINPDKRISADHALKHPYVKQFHNPLEEIVAGKEVVPLLDDSLQLSLDAYRSKLYEMIDEGLLQMKQNQPEIVEPTETIDKETTNNLSSSPNPNEMSSVHQDETNQDSGFCTQRITSQGQDDNEIQSEDNVNNVAEEIDHQSKFKELETKGENHSTGPTQQNLDVKSDEKISKSIEHLSLTKTKPNIKVKKCEVLPEKPKRKEPCCENDKKSLRPMKSNKTTKQQSQPKLNNPPFGSNKSQTFFSSKSYKLPRLEPSTLCLSTTQSKGDLPKLKPSNSSKELAAIYGTRAPSATLQDSAAKQQNRVPFRHASAPASSSLNQFRHKLNYPARCPITDPTIPKAIGIPNKVQKRSTKAKVCWEAKCIK